MGGDVQRRRPPPSWRGGAVRLLMLLLASAWVPAQAQPQPSEAQPPARSDADLALVRERIAAVEVLRGRFEQDRRIAGFRKPLRSQGRFLLVRGRGVVWTTEAPFASETVVTGERIVVHPADGGTRVVLDGERQPAMREVGRAVLALVGGDLDALSRRFDTAVQRLPGDAWRMELRPRDRRLARAFARIVLQGDRYVRQVEMEDAGGDRTTLRFADLRETPATLSDEEAARLD